MTVEGRGGGGECGDGGGVEEKIGEEGSKERMKPVASRTEPSAT